MIIDFLAPPLLLLLVIAGAAVGIVAGLVGIGGGVLFVPLLLFLLPADITPADERLPFIFGTTLAVSWLIAVASSSVHRKRITGLGREGAWLGIAAVIGAQGGAAAAANLPSAALEIILALLLIAVAPLLVFAVKDRAEETVGAGDEPAEEVGGDQSLEASGTASQTNTAEASPGHDPAIVNAGSDTLRLALTGLLVGFLSSAVGLGGALLSIPALIFILKYDSRRAMAVAPVMMSLAAASAVIGYIVNGLGTPGLPAFSVGYVNVAIAGVLAITAIPAALIGARLAHKTNARLLRILLAVILVIVGLDLLYGRFF